MNKWHKQKYCCDCNKPLGKKAQYNGTKRCQSCAAKKQFKNPKNHQKYIDGRTLKKYYCKDCGKEINKHNVKRCCHCNDIYLHKIGKLNSKGLKNPMYGIHRYGKKAPAFIHGKCYLPYPVEWFEMRLKIRDKFNNRCYICNKKAKHVHHIDYCKDNCKENNLILLCANCHSKTNGNRDYWYAYFKYFLGE